MGSSTAHSKDTNPHIIQSDGLKQGLKNSWTQSVRVQFGRCVFNTNLQFAKHWHKIFPSFLLQKKMLCIHTVYAWWKLLKTIIIHWNKCRILFLCILSVITQFPTIKVWASNSVIDKLVSAVYWHWSTLVSAEIISCIYLAIVAINNAAVPNALQMSQH